MSESSPPATPRKSRRVAVAVLLALLVIGAVIVAVSKTNTSTTTRTEYLTTTIIENQKVVGDCIRTGYIIPDTVEAISRNITITSGNTTMYSASTTVIEPSEAAYGTPSTFTTSSYANINTTLVVTSTSTDQGQEPSSVWYVTVCTFSP